LAEKPDVVVIATGAQSRGNGTQAMFPQPVPGSDLPHVTTASDLLTDSTRQLGHTALVLDDIGHYEAIAAAEYLAARDVAVTFVTGLPSFAPKMNGTFRNEKALQSLYRGNFRLLVGHSLIAIYPQHCVVRPLRTARTEEIAADTVVLVTQKTPVRNLYDELRGQVPDIKLVGDAASPRTLQDAIREGHLAVRALA
ncbi:MAG: NADH-flavin oxidoreductase/NADH oxidase, partial [Steroidobacteraceae bacterium]